MTFRRYEQYKDSGVEWLGEVPAHWELMLLGRATGSRCDGPFGSGIKSEHYTEAGALVVRLQNIRAEGFVVGEPAFIDLNYFEQELRRHEVLADDILIAGLGDDNNLVGRACVAPGQLGPALVKADCFRFRVVPSRVRPQFLASQLTAGARFDASRLSSGTTRSRIPLGTMASRNVCLPPLSEQDQIIQFVDHETAKIDGLVEEQTRLIELLKERRQAVISQAVTKGLNPNAPMKDSGVEWLGEVPAHWNLTCIKRLATLQRGHDLTDAERTGGGFPVITSGGFNGTHGSFMATGPGVVTGRYGSTGKLYFVEEDYWPHNTTLYVSDFHGNVAKFVWYSLQIVDFSAHSAKSAVPGIDRNDIHPLPAVVPAPAEQREIVDYLDDATAQIDLLSAESAKAIRLLFERRTALISAAVTGKIDVRSKVQQPEPAAA